MTPSLAAIIAAAEAEGLQVLSEVLPPTQAAVAIQVLVPLLNKVARAAQGQAPVAHDVEIVDLRSDLDGLARRHHGG